MSDWEITAAKASIRQSWPEAEDWRFCESADDWQPTERFAFTQDWQRRRFEAAKV